MNLRKYNFIFQIIFYILFNVYFLQSARADELINNEIPENNIEINSKTPELQEDSYLLGAGDQLVFNVIGADELKTPVRILNDGKAVIPLLGPVKLKGHTISSANKYLETLLSKELINPKVELTIYAIRPTKVSIVGEVLRPGIYNLKDSNTDLPTVITAIEEAGGISQFANLTEITLRRRLPGEKESYKKTNLNFKNLIFEGDQSQNPYLFDGDIIELKKVKNLDKDLISIKSTSLAPKRIKVNFLGEIERPNSIYLDSNSTLIDGILAAGGPINWRSNYGNVEILRINRDGSASRKKYKIDLSQSYSAKNNPILNHGDSVWIRRNNYAKTSDALKAVSSPLKDIVNVWALFTIFD